MKNNLKEMLDKMKDAYGANTREELSDLMDRDTFVITVSSISKPLNNGTKLRTTVGRRITIATGTGTILHQQYTNVSHSYRDTQAYLDIANTINRCLLPGQQRQPGKERTGNTCNFFNRIKLLWGKLLSQGFYFKG